MGYELIYFSVKGRGESIRLLFSDNNIEYKEVNCGPEWTTWKSKMAFGQTPCLMDGTFQLVQSCAILRYLARKYGLYADNDTDAARIDELNDGVEDLRGLYVKLIYQNYDAGKAKYIEELPGRLQPFENLLKASGAGDSGAAVNGKISFVDYNLFDLLDIHQILSPGCLDAFPTLKAYYTKVVNRPGIQKHRATDVCKNMPINGNGKQ